jgi:hypothetical protein
MKLYAAFVCAVMMLPLFAHAGPAPREVVIVNAEPIEVVNLSGGEEGDGESSSVGFLGFSMLPGVAGGDGLLAMRQACGMFGAGARMCTSEEILESTALTDQGAGTAWVRVAPISDAAPAREDHRASFIDASGVYFSEEFANCNGWTYAPGPFDPPRQALIVTGSFVFDVGSCRELRPVACCGTPQ